MNEHGLPDAENVPPPPERPAYSEDGVDLTLIRWMLSLTPAERLQVLEQHVEAIMRLRDANPDLSFSTHSGNLRGKGKM
jgi:hypothetical protein